MMDNSFFFWILTTNYVLDNIPVYWIVYNVIKPHRIIIYGSGSKPWYPFCSHENSWDLWMFIPLKMVLIGIDPYPYI
jgi:hypothetical protein